MQKKVNAEVVQKYTLAYTSTEKKKTDTGVSHLLIS